MYDKQIDVERSYTPEQTADKLRRIADAIEDGKSFRIQVGGNQLRIPTDGKIEIEINRDGNRDEIEIDIKWDRTLTEPV